MNNIQFKNEQQTKTFARGTEVKSRKSIFFGQLMRADAIIFFYFSKAQSKRTILHLSSPSPIFFFLKKNAKSSGWQCDRHLGSWRKNMK